MNNRFKFRAFYKDFPLCDDERGDYTKSFMIYNVSPYGGHDVGTYAEDFEDQLTEQGFTEDEIEQVRDYFSHYEYEDWINFWADDIEQCTGLKDKAGKLIYEGDIVFINGEKWRVIWDDEDCAFFFSNLKEVYHQPIFPDFYMGRDDFNAIGNIHENEELLK